MMQAGVEKGCRRMVEGVLAEVFRSMMRPLNGVRAEPETEKVLEVLTTTSDEKVASDLHVRPEVAAGNSDEAVMCTLKGRIWACFEQLTPSKDAPQPDRRLQALGPDWSE